MLNTLITYEDIKKAADSGKPIHLECPFCHAQYLPGEIYMPGALIGQPSDIVKDADGKIICVDYKKVDSMPNSKETFICEYCDQPFDVDAGYIAYKTTKADPGKNFKTQYVSLID